MCRDSGSCSTGIVQRQAALPEVGPRARAGIVRRVKIDQTALHVSSSKGLHAAANEGVGAGGSGRWGCAHGSGYGGTCQEGPAVGWWWDGCCAVAMDGGAGWELLGVGTAAGSVVDGVREDAHLAH